MDEHWIHAPPLLGAGTGVLGGCRRWLGTLRDGWPFPLDWQAEDCVEMPLSGARAVSWEMALHLACGGGTATEPIIA